jgi:hypothetical protein
VAFIPCTLEVEMPVEIFKEIRFNLCIKCECYGKETNMEKPKLMRISRRPSLIRIKIYKKQQKKKYISTFG